MSLVDGIIGATFPVGLRNTWATYRGYTYFANGWTRMRRWGGAWQRRVDWSGSDEYQEVPYAGIEGPDPEEGSWAPTPTESPSVLGGGWTAGSHRFRYRHMDSRTGYVSNPSATHAVTVTGGVRLSFPIASSGAGNIIRSADPKVDTIVLEASVAANADDETADDEFFWAAEVRVKDAAGNYNTALVADLTSGDAELEQNSLDWENDGQDIPPLKSIVIVHRGRLILFGERTHSRGTVTTTINSPTVVGSGTDWTEDALGTENDPPRTGRRLFRSGTYEWYEILSWDSATQLTLETYFGAANAANEEYEIASADQRIYFSREGEPESFPPTSYIELAGGVGGRLTAGVGYDDSILFFTERNSYRFTYVDEPSENGQSFPIPGDRGALSQRVVVVAVGRVYSLDRQGAWVYQGGIPISISDPIKKLLSQELDWSNYATWHGIFLDHLRVVRWYVTRTGETVPKFYVQVDPVTGKWSTGEEDAEVSESHQAWLSTEQPLQPLLGDSRGNVWNAGTGTADGGNLGGDDTSRNTVAAGSPSSSVIAVTDDLTSAGDLRGVAVTWLKADGSEETRLISHNGTHALILVTAFSQVPDTGALLMIGRIKSRLRSRVFYARRRPSDAIRARTVRIFYKPIDRDTPRYARLRMYEDWSETPKAWDTERDYVSSDNLRYPGSVAGYPDTDWLIDATDASGFAEIHVGDDPCFSFQVELLITDPDVPLELWGIEVEGVEAESEA